VEKGESLLEVETAKVVIEVKSPASGKISKILAPEGAEIPVAEKIAIIE
jgi:pyruvate/2-oxoglutarate dehydrogenase complex dihydrolipoamide acyltransferase (E2) component